jgi:hypothetical protein
VVGTVNPFQRLEMGDASKTVKESVADKVIGVGDTKLSDTASSKPKGDRLGAILVYILSYPEM